MEMIVVTYWAFLPLSKNGLNVSPKVNLWWKLMLITFTYPTQNISFPWTAPKWRLLTLHTTLLHTPHWFYSHFGHSPTLYKLFSRIRNEPFLIPTSYRVLWMNYTSVNYTRIYLMLISSYSSQLLLTNLLFLAPIFILLSHFLVVFMAPLNSTP